MGGASDVRAGGAFVEIFTKDSRFQAGLRAAQARLRAFGSQVTAIGAKITGAAAVAFTPFAAAATAFISTGDALDDLSQKTSIGVNTLSAFRYVAELTGTSLEDMAKGLSKAQKLVTGAANGNKAAAKSLAELGLNAKDLVNLSPEQLFTKLVDSLSKIDNPTKRAAASLEIFGKGAGAMGELIRKGGPEIDRLMQQASDLGLIMSDEDAAAAGEFKDALYGLRQQVAFLVGIAFVPWLKEITTWLSQAAARIAKFMKANKDLVTNIVKVIAVVAAVGAGLVAVGALFSSIGVIIGAIVGTLTAIGAAFGVVSAAIGFLISPIGLVIAGITALVVWFATCTEAGQAMIGSLIAVWQEFAGEAVTSFNAVVQAFKAGDIEAAWRVITSFLNLEWTKFIAFLQTSWAGWKGYFLGIWNQVTSALAIAWENAVNAMALTLLGLWVGLRVGWTESLAFIQQGWVFLKAGMTNVANFFAKIFINALDYFTTFLQKAIKGLELIGVVSEGTSASIRQMFEAANKRIDDRATSPEKREQELADIEMNRAKQRAAIAKTFNGVQEGIAQQHADKLTAIDKAQAEEEERIKAATNATVAAQEAKVQEARKAWEGAVQAATKAGEIADSMEAPLLSPNVSETRAVVPNKRQERQIAMLDDPTLSEGKRARITRNLEKQGLNLDAVRASANATDGVADAMGKVESRGTFNPLALQSLAMGGGGIAQKQLDAMKKVSDEQEKGNTKLDKIEQNTRNGSGAKFK